MQTANQAPPPGFIAIKPVAHINNQTKTKKLNPASKLTNTNKKTQRKYISSQNTPLPPEINSRLDALYIPPAYNNLLVAKSANNKIQVIGEDTAGRKQYIYNEKHKAGLEKRKYSKLAKLAPKIQLIASDNMKAISRLAKQDSATWTKADLIDIVLYMLIKYHFRIGCSKYAEIYKSYGITTLKPAHFKRRGTTYLIEFIGKKGMKNKTVEYTRPGIKIINGLLKRCNTNGWTYIFNYKYTNPVSGAEDIGLVGSNDIQDLLLDKYKVKGTPKMFRTYYANYHMIEYLKHFMATDEYKAMEGNYKAIGKHLKREIADYVSGMLNNTPAICKKNYLNNDLFESIVSRPEKYIPKIAAGKNLDKLVIDLLNF